MLFQKPGKKGTPVLDRDKKKSLLIGAAVFLALTTVLVIFVRHLDADIFTVLKETKPSFLLLLLLCGALSHLPDFFLWRMSLSEIGPSLGVFDAFAVTVLQVFGRTVLLPGGALSVQSYYLSRQGVMAGRSASVGTLLYSSEKFSVLLYALVLLLVNLKTVRTLPPAAVGFIPFGFFMCLVIISGLVLICTSKRVCRGVIRLIGKLPSGGKWPKRKETWCAHIRALRQESAEFLREKKRLVWVLLWNLCRTVFFCTVPYLVVRIMGIPGHSFLEMETLSALMFLLAHSLPNIAGMGAPEFSFLLIFTEVLQADAAAAMIYYRCATYYFPFLISLILLIPVRCRFRAHAVEKAAGT